MRRRTDGGSFLHAARRENVLRKTACKKMSVPRRIRANKGVGMLAKRIMPIVPKTKVIYVATDMLRIFENIYPLSENTENKRDETG